MKIACTSTVLRVNYRRFAGKRLVRPGQLLHNDVPLAAFPAPWHRPGWAGRNAEPPAINRLIRLIDTNLIIETEARPT